MARFSRLMAVRRMCLTQCEILALLVLALAKAEPDYVLLVVVLLVSIFKSLLFFYYLYFLFMGFVFAVRGVKLARCRWVLPTQQLRVGHRTLVSAATSTKRPLSCSVGFVLGGPGSGKSYQCAIAAKTLPLLHVSVGDVLREAVDPTLAQPGLRRLRVAEPQLELIRDVFKSGKILPAEISIELLYQEFQRRLEARVGRDAETDVSPLVVLAPPCLSS